MARRATNKRAQTCQNFFHVKRLGDIVICTSINTRNLITPAVACGQYQHWHTASSLTPFLENCNAINCRQPNIKDHGIIGFSFTKKVTFFTVHY